MVIRTLLDMYTSPQKAIALLIPLAAATLLAAPQYASAAPPRGSDLVPSFVATPGLVNTTTRVEVRIANNGNRDSGAVSVVIALPRTATSPTVAVMGTVSNLSTGCSRTGTTMNCSIPTGVPRNNAKQVGFDIVLPYSANPIDFRADVTTTNDSNVANNGATHQAASAYYGVAAPSATALVNNSHCTGSSLSSYFECQLFPSSIASHQVSFVPTGAGSGMIDFSVVGPEGVGYGGSWSVSGTQLTFDYTENGTPVGNFVGQGSTPNCWDGVFTFSPASTYNAIYRVCV